MARAPVGQALFVAPVNIERLADMVERETSRMDAQPEIVILDPEQRFVITTDARVDLAPVQETASDRVREDQVFGFADGDRAARLLVPAEKLEVGIDDVGFRIRLRCGVQFGQCLGQQQVVVRGPGEPLPARLAKTGIERGGQLRVFRQPDHPHARIARGVIDEDRGR